MNIFVAGISYKTAPVELREQLAIAPSTAGCQACRMKIAADLAEIVLVSTCNRIEIYFAAENYKGRGTELFDLISYKDSNFSPFIYFHSGADAVKHLFSVVSGLDSMVVGETEINGQVKNAYHAAQAARLTGNVLNRVFQTAFQTAKKVRNETRIGCGAVSVGSVAVELADKLFADGLSGKTVLIVGAGKMGETCVRHLAKKKNASVLVTNRSFEKAELLAGKLNGRAVRFEDCLSAMTEADIVVTSVSSANPILERSQLIEVMRARRNRELFLIDIGMPRNIQPDAQTVPGIYLYNVDHLEGFVRENVAERERELAVCFRMIDERTCAVMEKLNAPRKDETPISSKAGWLFGPAAICNS
jgi:glutamyl-tRNA reductase